MRVGPEAATAAAAGPGLPEGASRAFSRRRFSALALGADAAGALWSHTVRAEPAPDDVRLVEFHWIDPACGRVVLARLHWTLHVVKAGPFLRGDGLDDIMAILRELPPALNAVVLIVLHRLWDRPSHLAAVLGRAARMPVVVALDGGKFTPGTATSGSRRTISPWGRTAFGDWSTIRTGTTATVPWTCCSGP